MSIVEEANKAMKEAGRVIDELRSKLAQTEKERDALKESLTSLGVVSESEYYKIKAQRDKFREALERIVRTFEQHGYDCEDGYTDTEIRVLRDANLVLSPAKEEK